MFARSGDRNRHIKTNHEGQSNYKCDSCGKSFQQSGGLKTHIKRFHERSGNYKCDSCGKPFTGSGNLKYHVKRIHEAQSNNKWDSCGKSFIWEETSKESIGEKISWRTSKSQIGSRIHQIESLHLQKIC